MKRKWILLLCAVILISGTAVVLWQTGVLDSMLANGHVSDKEFEQVVNSEDFKQVAPVSSGVVETKDITIVVRDEDTVLDEMHKMANTKIVADQIWGKVDTTTERINMLILEVEKSEYKNKKQLLDILKRWKDGDFRQAVQDHNFLWDRLGGTVGKAQDLNEKTKEAMAAKYGE